MIARRSFLAGMLAACSAPAIVRAESLMKIIVPSDEILLLTWRRMDFGAGDDFFTIERIGPLYEDMDFIHHEPGKWHQIAKTRINGVVTRYIDGKPFR